MTDARRLRSVDTALWAALPALSALSVVGTALSPVLAADHPLLLVAMSPRYPFLALAAAESAVLPFALVAFVRLAAADAPSFLLARRHGHHVQRLAARWALSRWVERFVSRAFDRLGLAMVALSPTGKVLALAGASQVEGRRVAAASAVGTAAQVALLYGAGSAWAVGH